MRRPLIITLALVAFGAASADAQTSPQLARIGAAGAVVRSGPGEAFYPTGRLEAGERVEIYRRKENGWCAIRPPEGSFSYVRADHVSPTENAGLLEVTQSGSKTRVGSTLKPAYQVEYVSLKLGERLKSLGGPLRLGTSPHAWYQVAPPSGEFRWVNADDLQRGDKLSSGKAAAIIANAPSRSSKAAVNAGGTEKPHAATADSTVPARSNPERRPNAARPQSTKSATANRASDRPTASSHGLAVEKLSAVRRQMATEPIPRSVMAVDQSVTGASHSEPANSTPAWQEGADGQTQAVPATRGPDLPVASDPIIRLAELELYLSRVVTQPVERWELAPLRQQVVELQVYLLDEATRRAAQQLLERIDEFARLQQRHLDLEVPSADAANPTFSLTAALEPRPAASAVTPSLASSAPEPPNQFLAREAAIRRQADNVHYAGQGWLVPVLSSHTHLPRFALANRAGSIQAFVTPRPGLNLRRYLRQEVGIVGRETVSIDNTAPHLIADRVVVLDRHR